MATGGNTTYKKSIGRFSNFCVATRRPSKYSIVVGIAPTISGAMNQTAVE